MGVAEGLGVGVGVGVDVAVRVGGGDGLGVAGGDAVCVGRAVGVKSATCVGPAPHPTRSRTIEITMNQIADRRGAVPDGESPRLCCLVILLSMNRAVSMWKRKCAAARQKAELRQRVPMGL